MSYSLIFGMKLTKLVSNLEISYSQNGKKSKGILNLHCKVSCVKVEDVRR